MSHDDASAGDPQPFFVGAHAAAEGVTSHLRSESLEIHPFEGALAVAPPLPGSHQYRFTGPGIDELATESVVVTADGGLQIGDASSRGTSMRSMRWINDALWLSRDSARGADGHTLTVAADPPVLVRPGNLTFRQTWEVRMRGEIVGKITTPVEVRQLSIVIGSLASVHHGPNGSVVVTSVVAVLAPGLAGDGGAQSAAPAGRPRLLSLAQTTLIVLCSTGQVLRRHVSKPQVALAQAGAPGGGSSR